MKDIIALFLTFAITLTFIYIVQNKERNAIDAKLQKAIDLQQDLVREVPDLVTKTYLK